MRIVLIYQSVSISFTLYYLFISVSLENLIMCIFLLSFQLIIFSNFDILIRLSLKMNLFIFSEDSNQFFYKTRWHLHFYFHYLYLELILFDFLKNLNIKKENNLLFCWDNSINDFALIFILISFGFNYLFTYDFYWFICLELSGLSL
jgi:hypothetical protein